MTTQQIASMVAGFGLPFAYDHFSPTPSNPMPAPPFVCFMVSGGSNVYADDANYVQIPDVAVELYTANKDYALEAQIEECLREKGLSWAKEGPAYIGSEKLYMTTWTMSVVIEEGETNGE